MTEPRIFRAPMRSRRDGIPAAASVERALVEGLCGMGGVVEPAPTSVREAAVRVAAQHDERTARRLERFAAAPDGAYVWTRDVEGWFWLGRLDGPWRYDASREAAAVDLVHVRRCRWQSEPIPDAHVPGGVRHTFARGGRNWQETHDRDAARATAALWDERA